MDTQIDPVCDSGDLSLVRPVGGAVCRTFGRSRPSERNEL